jgi:CHRD domain
MTRTTTMMPKRSRRKEKPMKRSIVAAFVTTVAVPAMLGTLSLAKADDDHGRNSLKARLKGFEEVPANSTTGKGELRITIVDADSLDFKLTYEDLEGTATSAAHVHLGQKTANGGVSFFLCGGGGRPACTPTSGEFTGTVTAADVIGPAGQGIAAGEFAEIVKAMRAGAAYANVHTNKHPGGEIRGQIRGNDDDD